MNGPLEVEIGCGVGHHPEARARSLPAHRVVAIEHTREKFGKFQRRLQDLGCPPNLHVVHANAISWVTHFLQPHQVDRYFLLYPNPHPKTRDRGQRWHQMSFFEQLLKTLKPGGELVLATNLEWYASEAVAWICDHWGMRLLEKRSLSAELSPELVTQARTLFERKYLERGEICWNLVFQKPL